MAHRNENIYYSTLQKKFSDPWSEETRDMELNMSSNQSFTGFPPPPGIIDKAAIEIILTVSEKKMYST